MHSLRCHPPLHAPVCSKLVARGTTPLRLRGWADIHQRTPHLPCKARKVRPTHLTARQAAYRGKEAVMGITCRARNYTSTCTHAFVRSVQCMGQEVLVELK